MKVHVSDERLELIHTALFNFITALNLGLVFSARLAITNELIAMIKHARDNGQADLVQLASSQNNQPQSDHPSVPERPASQGEGVPPVPSP